MLLKDKFDFLLKITMTSNRQLAKEMNLDASFVSRIRRGARGLPTNSEYRVRIGEYFARHIKSDYQRQALAETLGHSELRTIDKEESISKVILDWISNDDSALENPTASFLSGFNKFRVFAPAFPSSFGSQTPDVSTQAENYVFYGNEGRRNAVKMMFDRLINLEHVNTLKILTDESLEWLLEDKKFSEEVTNRLLALANKGCCMKRITPFFSSADIAFDSLMRWMHLYMTTRVESYYYPRLRDDLYRRTLFAVPGVVALVGTSVGDKKEVGLSFLSFSKQASHNFSAEFNDYLEKCRPLTSIYNAQTDMEALFNCTDRFNSFRTPTIRKIGCLPSNFTPRSLLKEIFTLVNPHTTDAVLLSVEKSQRDLEENCKGHRSIDIIRLATPQEIVEGKIPVLFSTLFESKPRYYTPSEYIEHLQNILEHLNNFENYSVFFDDEEENILYVKDECVALLIKRDPPATVFEIADRNVIASCYAYLQGLTRTQLSYNEQRKQACERINELIKALKQVDKT